MILDAETFALVPGVRALLAGAEGRELPGLFKTELHASIVELNTGICASVDEARAALGALRRSAAEIARAEGMVIAAAGTHPFSRAEEQEVRRRAADEDETRFAILAIFIGAIVASLAALVILLVRSKGGHGLERDAAPALAVLTLVISWLMMQTVFVLHYAHRHFGDRNRDGAGDGGFEFPGEPARTYRDFVYLSLCIGATFQVSDPQVMRSSLRNLVAVHSAVAYFYNTAILALGINIVAGLIGR